MDIVKTKAVVMSWWIGLRAHRAELGLVGYHRHRL